MTLSTTTSKVSYSGDGATTSFTIPFLFLADGDIQAVLRDAAGVETTWTENTEYTLSGAGSPSGGTLTVNTSPTDYTPASGTTLVVRRVVPETQGTDYPEGGAFPAAAHEQALDRLTMLVQQKSEEIARALMFPVSDSASLSNEIPNSASRASKFLGFDASGAPIAAAGTSANLGPVSAFIETLLDDSDAVTARTTLGALGASDSGANLSGVLKTGQHTIWMPATAMVARTSNGAASGTSELGTNKIMVKTLDFDGATAEYAQFMIAMPKSWDEGTLTFIPFWTGAAGAGTVRWRLSGVAVSNDDAMDVAQGTPQNSDDTFITADDCHVGPESPAITIAGTPAEGDLTIFEVSRDPANDTKAEDGKLIGVQVIMTIDAGDDS